MLPERTMQNLLIVCTNNLHTKNEATTKGPLSSLNGRLKHKILQSVASICFGVQLDIEASLLAGVLS